MYFRRGELGFDLGCIPELARFCAKETSLGRKNEEVSGLEILSMEQTTVQRSLGPRRT